MAQIFRRRDRLQHRSPARRSLLARLRAVHTRRPCPAVRRDHARPSSRTTAACCAQSVSRRPAASPATTTSRADRCAGSSCGRRSSSSRRSRRASRRGACIRCCTRRGRIAAWTTRRRRARRSSPSPRARRVGDLRQRQRAHGAGAPCVRLRVVLPAPVGVRAGHPRGRVASPGPDRRARRVPPGWPPVRICTTVCRRTASFVNPLREHRNLPPGDPVPASAMADFEAARDRALAQLERLAGTASSAPVVLTPNHRRVRLSLPRPANRGRARVAVTRRFLHYNAAWRLCSLPCAASRAGRCGACRRRAVRRRQHRRSARAGAPAIH